MLNASGIIDHACQIARVPRFATQALAELNAILAHICRTIDFSAARGVFDFTFNTDLTSSGAGNIISAIVGALATYLTKEIQASKT